jgi:hypothetical protein
MATVASKSETWALALANDWCNPTIDHKMLAVISMIKPNSTSADCIANIREDSGFGILAVNHFNEVSVFHNTSILGPNLRHPEMKILCLSGAGPTADCFRIHESSFDVDLNLEVPGWGDLKKTSSAEEVALLIVPENASKIKFKTVLMIPPLVVNAILQENTSDAARLIPAVSKAMQAFDRTSETAKACEHLRSVLFYLWAVTKKLVPPIISELDRSPEGLAWSQSKHSDFILPVAPPAPVLVSSVIPSGLVLDESYESQLASNQDKAFGNIAATLQLLTEQSSKELLKDPSSSKNASATELLPAVLRATIIKMSSTDDEAFPEDFCTTLKEIMGQKKIVPATSVMNLMLRSMKCQVVVPIALVTAIRHGNLMPDSLLASHIFSPFSVPYKEPCNFDIQQQLKIDLLQSDGEGGGGLPKELIEHLLKFNFEIPRSYHKLRHQLNNWLGVCMLVFGEKSLVAKEIKMWLKHADDNEQSYDACYKIDRDFGAKLLGNIALTFYMFCASCQTAVKPDDVNFSILSLQHKREEIEQLSFVGNMPPYLIPSGLKKRETPDDESVESIIKQKKKGKKNDGKQKGGGKDLGTLLKNSHQVREWDCKAVYKQLFTHKIIATTPPFNSSGIITCNKWHAQGHCFENCDRKETHKNFPDEAHKQAYGKWIKKLKEDHSKP